MEDIWKFIILEAILIFQGIVMLVNPKWWQIILIPIGMALGYFVRAGIKTEEE